jgi:hypothetical protein
MSDGAKSAKAKAKTERAEARKKEAEEKAKQHRQELEDAKGALAGFKDSLQGVREKQRRRDDLDHHLAGLYGEVDKLAKGKAMLEVTPLIVEEVNTAIRDAKAIIQGDTYLDRVKEFVPAGNNPVYPDVIVIVRAVRGAVQRAEADLKASKKHALGRYQNGRTIVAALNFYQKYDEHPTNEDIRAAIGDEPVLNWFLRTDDGKYYFNVEHLEEVGVMKAMTDEQAQP